MDASEKYTAIIQQVYAIPKGKVASYGAIAKLAGLPGYARYVGQVLKTLPEDTQVPWHRVLNSQGKISFVLGSDAYDRQAQRLAAEGITLIKGKVTKAYFMN